MPQTKLQYIVELPRVSGARSFQAIRLYSEFKMQRKRPGVLNVRLQRCTRGSGDHDFILLFLWTKESRAAWAVLTHMDARLRREAKQRKKVCAARCCESPPGRPARSGGYLASPLLQFGTMSVVPKQSWAGRPDTNGVIAGPHTYLIGSPVSAVQTADRDSVPRRRHTHVIVFIIRILPCTSVMCILRGVVWYQR